MVYIEILPEIKKDANGNERLNRIIELKSREY